MADLTLRSAATLIERAVFDAVNLALRVRLPPAVDLVALRATSTRGAGASSSIRRDHDLAFVTSEGCCFEWSSTCSLPDDGQATIKPDDVAASGRWLRTASTVQTGYLRDVRLYEGEQSEDEILTRLLGQWPAVVIRWVSATSTLRSQIPGALYRYQTDFDLWAVSSNLRGGALAEAVVGSPIASEAVVDPGVNAMIGDLKGVLAVGGGDEFGQPGITYCEIGREEPVYRSLAERRFVFSLGLRVYATVANADADLVAIDQIDAQPELADLHGEATFDPTNYVVSGLDVPLGLGLASTVSAGSAWVGGVSVTAGATAHTFDERADTYRDLLPDGSLVFTTVLAGAPPPPVTAGALRVGVTTTDAAGVIADCFLCATAAPFGEPNQIPKP